ncbi:hypothetical protein [Streptomyces sp. 7-21]|uniref:hypothetical protein n=1 Tax=Streptomyces sp. 7-21 TaxID=2802283 RepID=UPI001F459623|nr:hypothetical protein [Streptomyces sp. 7-21]
MAVPRPATPPPPYSATAPPPGPPPPYTPTAQPHSDPPPPYPAVPPGGFDPRKLSDTQLDELTHRLISRITRLVRTELRLDRERIGQLRDGRR